MIPNYPKIMPLPMAQNGNKNDIPLTSEDAGAFTYNEGFPSITQVPVNAGGKAPKRTDFNGALNELSQHIFFLQNGGQYQWSAELDYNTGAVILGSDNNPYQALRVSGPNSGGAKDPTVSENTAYWKNVANNSEELIAAHNVSEDAHSALFAAVGSQISSLLSQLAQKLDKTAVVNNLTSTVTTSALSAAQGKVLNDKIGAVFNGIVKLKGTRTATGTWTLTGLTVGRPLFVIHTATSESGTPGANLTAVSGTSVSQGGIDGLYFLGRASGYASCNVCIFVPSDTTVVFKSTVMQACKLSAYQ